MKALLVLLYIAMTALSLAKVDVLKDEDGKPVVDIDGVSMFRRSEQTGKMVAEFSAVVRNLGSSDVRAVPIDAVLKLKDGSEEQFSFLASFKDSSLALIKLSFADWAKFSPEEYSGVAFSLSQNWDSPDYAKRPSPEWTRRADQQADRQKRHAAEEKNRLATVKAREASRMAEERSRAIETQLKLRAACSALYASTADKKVRDLTVKEEQQVRACQSLGLYRAN